MRIHRSFHRAMSDGSTLTELLIATGVTGIIIAAFLTSFGSLQQSFRAVDAYSTAKSGQMRLTDYLALDLRRALTATPGSGGDTILSLTIPDYYGSDGAARTPAISGLFADYGDPAAPVAVSYFKKEGSIFRQESGGASIEIAANVKDFQISFEDLEKVVKTRVSFVPGFRQEASAQSRDGTSIHSTILLRNKRRD